MKGFLTSLEKEMARTDISEERRAALKSIYAMATGQKPAGLTAAQEKELRDALASITTTLDSPTLSDNARRELLKHYADVEKMLEPIKGGTTH